MIVALSHPQNQNHFIGHRKEVAHQLNAIYWHLGIWTTLPSTMYGLNLMVPYTVYNILLGDLCKDHCMAISPTPPPYFVHFKNLCFKYDIFFF